MCGKIKAFIMVKNEVKTRGELWCFWGVFCPEKERKINLIIYNC